VAAITLTINGKTISARAGRTILEVARDHGITIPTLCHSDFLRPIGACRVCQVEDEKRGMVVPSCVTQIQQGMVINTESPRVVRNRKNIVRLLLAAHPESCVVCEKGNRCELRRLAAQLGIAQHGLDSMPYHPTIVDVNPFLTRDLSKCIMCAKCMRADQDLVVEGVIEYTKRGFDAHPATLFEKSLESSRCTFCGSCLSVCPTGAIAEKDKHRLDHAGARSQSVCSFCACGCSIFLEHDYNALINIAPTAKKHTANGVTLCVKGHFGHDYINSPERLRTPLIRTEEGFKPLSWEEAINLVAEKLGGIKREYGPQALGFMGSTRATNEENYLFQKLARSVFETNNIDCASRAYWSPVAKVLAEGTGFAAGSSSFHDVEASEVILVIGADPTQTAPVMGYHIKRAVKGAGKKLILIDPLENKLASFAHLWLRPFVAADAALLKGLIKVLFQEDLVDSDFVSKKTEGFAELLARFSEVSLSQCARQSGVTEDDLRHAARTFASAGNGCIIFGSGVMQQENAPEVAKLLLDLLFLTGNMGKEGAGLIPLLKDCNSQGAWDMGITPDSLPGHKSLDDEKTLAMFREAWNAVIPSTPGLTSLGMLSAARHGKMKGMFVFCENPVGIYPDVQGVTEALSGLAFLVVQDMFLTETAKLAQVVLPAAAFAEKEGTVTNLERRVQRLNRAVLPPGDFPSEWQVFAQLAGRLGHNWTYQSVDDILKEIERTVPLYGGTGEADLDNKAVFWPLPGLEAVVDTIPHGIGRPEGKALFLEPQLTDGAGLPEEPGYPFVLMQGHILQHLGAGTRSLHSKRLRRMAPHALLGVSTPDFQALNLKEGDRVRLVSSSGSLEIFVHEDKRLPQGVLFIPSSFPEAPYNVLFPGDWRNGSDGFVKKHCRVNLEKV
jgi:formate dehydrogenase alpha subunit